MACRQAMVPRGAEVLANPQGTAPGLYLPPLPVPGRGQSSPHLFLLPGPPRELMPMVRDHLLPRLAAMAPPAPAMRNFHLSGLGETQVAVDIDLVALYGRLPVANTVVVAARDSGRRGVPWLH